MIKLDEIQKRLLREVADLHEVPEGAFNIRSNSESVGRASTANIEIVSKEDVAGIDIRIRPGTKNESVHIPVVMTKSGLTEVVYNDFYIGEDCDVTIVAGGGIGLLIKKCKLEWLETYALAISMVVAMAGACVIAPLIG